MTRILAVDDEPQVLRALATNLRARGYEVDLAQTGEAALALVARKHPDLVVLDLGLPGMDGFEVIQGLRGWSSGAPDPRRMPPGRGSSRRRSLVSAPSRHRCPPHSRRVAPPVL